MVRPLPLFFLGLAGCFAAHEGAATRDAEGPGTGDGALADGATTMLFDGPASVDGRPLLDGLAVDCSAGDLCELRAAFEAPEPGWTEEIAGNCTVTISGGHVTISTTGPCVAGTECAYRSPVRNMGTGRVVTRSISLSPENGGSLWFEVVDRSHDGPRLYYRPGIAKAVVRDGGGESDIGATVRGDVAAWSIRVDDGDVAHVEQWVPGTGIWRELGTGGGAPWSPSEDVTMALGLTCTTTTDNPISGRWAAVSGAP